MSVKNTFSLSLQKQIASRNMNLDTEINRTFNELKLRSLLHRCHFEKQKGYLCIHLLFVLILLPFLNSRLSRLWSGKYLANFTNAKKDTLYRFLNHERFNWRKLLYLIALKTIAAGDEVPLREKTLIADDTNINKTGKNMELVSYHFDHKTGKSILGYQCLQLGYHNGINFFPLDVAQSTSSNRPNKKLRDIDKRTIGWQRRKDSFIKKTDMLIEMVDRSWKMGIDASFVLFDSWFSYDAIIAKILMLGYGVICRLKKGNVKYVYNGKAHTLKQLWKIVKKETQWVGSKHAVKAKCIDVLLPKSGIIRIAFISDGKKQWQAFLCTDIELEASKILEYYARRWAIEVFFKDAKQLLDLGKEQSQTFDAMIAGYSLVMLRYLLLVYILNKGRITGALGPLFRELSEQHQFVAVADQLWSNFKELLLNSSYIICHEIEPDTLFYLIDLIENIIITNTQLQCAKV
jgi:hypothetical protein